MIESSSVRELHPYALADTELNLSVPPVSIDQPLARSLATVRPFANFSIWFVYWNHCNWSLDW